MGACLFPCFIISHSLVPSPSLQLSKHNLRCLAVGIEGVPCYLGCLPSRHQIVGPEVRPAPLVTRLTNASTCISSHYVAAGQTLHVDVVRRKLLAWRYVCIALPAHCLNKACCVA